MEQKQTLRAASALENMYIENKKPYYNNSRRIAVIGQEILEELRQKHCLAYKIN